MSLVLKIVLIVIALAGVPVGFAFYDAVLSHEGGKASNWGSAGYHGAPGPIAGAGLPGLAVGFGVYWLVRRRRKSS